MIEEVSGDVLAGDDAALPHITLFLNILLSVGVHRRQIWVNTRLYAEVLFLSQHGTSGPEENFAELHKAT